MGELLERQSATAIHLTDVFWNCHSICRVTGSYICFCHFTFVAVWLCTALCPPQVHELSDRNLTAKQEWRLLCQTSSLISHQQWFCLFLYFCVIISLYVYFISPAFPPPLSQLLLTAPYPSTAPLLTAPCIPTAPYPSTAPLLTAPYPSTAPLLTAPCIPTAPLLTAPPCLSTAPVSLLPFYKLSPVSQLPLYWLPPVSQLPLYWLPPISLLPLY